jgi:precorrin-8X/cobalt-precorrin-8 methylmutase
MQYLYETDGAAIYLKSFAMIRAEADLAHFTAEEEVVVVRMIHAAGMVGLAEFVRFSPGMAIAARAALEAGAPILCDAKMVSEGITRTRLPAKNEVICTLQDPRVPELAKAMANTRSAAALELAQLWRSAMHQPLCFIFSICCRTKLVRAPRPSSVARWALSALRNPRPR